MKPRLLILFVLLAIWFTSAAQNYVTLYSDCYFKGNNTTLKSGRYYLNQTNVGAQNLSSIKVPAGMKAVLYTGSEPGSGDKVRYTSDVYCLVSSGWNDKAVSIVVEDQDANYNGNAGNNNNDNWYNRDRDKVVAVFADANYGGSRNDYAIGFYNLYGSNLDRSITSMYVRPGYSIIVYDQFNRGGNSRTYTNNNNNLSDDGWNDRIRSFVVQGNNGSGNNGNYNPGNNNNNNNNNWYDRGRDKVVAVFADANYGGNRIDYAVGVYNLNGNLDRNITSMYVRPGYAIVVYDQRNMGGNSRTYTDNNSNLSADGWNDRIRSFVIREN